MHINYGDVALWFDEIHICVTNPHGEHFTTRKNPDDNIAYVLSDIIHRHFVSLSFSNIGTFIHCSLPRAYRLQFIHQAVHLLYSVDDANIRATNHE